MVRWDAQQYERFAGERTQPAWDLARRVAAWVPAGAAAIEPEGAADRRAFAPFAPRRILDVGCGPANSTEVLARTFPDAALLGVDSSPDMLAAARAGALGGDPRVSFALFDAADDPATLPGPFDLVFSNACLQWVPDNAGVVARLMGALIPGGLLAVQVPVNESEPIHQVIDAVVRSDRWKARFPRPRIFHTLSRDGYFDALAALTPTFSLWRTTYCHRLRSYDDILQWYRGTGLRPYLQALDTDAERAALEREVMAGVRERYEVRPNGEIVFPFPRLFFIAEKPGVKGGAR